MKPLSESLEDLTARVKTLKASAAATIATDRAKLEHRRRQIDEALQADIDDVESAVREATAAGRTWWNETKLAMSRPLDEVRARVDNRQSEHELHRALRIAEAAEEDAAAAIELAGYFLNIAEYAVIDAALAWLTVDDLTGEPTDEPATASTVGATS